MIKSGHRAKNLDKHDVNDISGHASGHDNTISALDFWIDMLLSEEGDSMVDFYFKN